MCKWLDFLPPQNSPFSSPIPNRELNPGRFDGERPRSLYEEANTTVLQRRSNYHRAKPQPSLLAWLKKKNKERKNIFIPKWKKSKGGALPLPVDVGLREREPGRGRLRRLRRRSSSHHPKIPEKKNKNPTSKQLELANPLKKPSNPLDALPASPLGRLPPPSPLAARLVRFMRCEYARGRGRRRWRRRRREKRRGGGERRKFDGEKIIKIKNDKNNRERCLVI